MLSNKSSKPEASTRSLMPKSDYTEACKMKRIQPSPYFFSFELGQKSLFRMLLDPVVLFVNICK